VLEGYLRDFCKIIAEKDIPPFFLFFCLVTPTPNPNSRDWRYWLWRWFHSREFRKSAEKTLRILQKEGICAIPDFEEPRAVEKQHVDTCVWKWKGKRRKSFIWTLGTLEKDDVDSWFTIWRVPKPEDFQEELKKIFGERDRASMVSVEKWLRQRIEVANKDCSGLHDDRDDRREAHIK
jgi:hypothetical protein